MTRPRIAPGANPAAHRAVLTLVLLAPAAALAHPGHDGGFLPGLLHPLHGLDHLLAAIAVGALGAKLNAQAMWALPVAFVAAMLAGGLFGHAGIVLPATEFMIALSVLLLGLALIANARINVTAGAAAVAAFALFHGGAHGAEAPTDAGYALYAFGLIVSTLALHMSGVMAALALRARPWVLRRAAAPVAIAGLALVAARLG